MDRAFIQELMEKTGFPAEARQAFTQAEEQLLSAGQEAPWTAPWSSTMKTT